MSTTTVCIAQAKTLGNAVPPFTPHAISVSLPTWKDNVGYEEGEKRVVDSMVTGYPRFFIHRSIQQLASICEQKFGVADECCILVPSRKIAEECRAFLLKLSPDPTNLIPVRLVQFLIEDETGASRHVGTLPSVELHIVLFPAQHFPLAKQFWQHTGLGISSRLAEHCLALISTASNSPKSTSPTIRTSPCKPSNRHYLVKSPISPSVTRKHQDSQPQIETFDAEQGTYLEERYGRNMPLTAAPAAKRALRRRIAGVLVHDEPGDCPSGPCAGNEEAKLGPSSRGENVSEDDVYLFPTGMTAIWSAHQLALAARPPARSVCFGFPYTDTLKILEKWGPGCHFFGHGLDADIDDLESLLVELTRSQDATGNTAGKSPPILALFCEFPSNPLLRSPNLPRLRALADKHDFLIVVDETVGNFVNVEVLPHVDIVVSSLTKVFSGDSNVMGGSLVLNPRARHYAALKATLEASYEDNYFAEDAIFMERNSRDFKRRIHVMNTSGEAVCDFLRSRSLAATPPPPHAVIKEVFYPKFITRENFDLCRNRSEDGAEDEPYFGPLFSITFTTKAASEAFFDALPCHKGPSLGTNFTLACPYTVLAHYTELDWAQKYGVEEGLVRVSVGLEGREQLLADFEIAIKAAEATA
ncbi:PLP-dependent transferase [Rickenella mellea]|uniref:PLP-dependent transferase n=1 Tax=Rickenella mellea TaxID=50990 RepID=A0A4Y7Q6C4_9AGAM|nr:PLP-dependent transferase [Rickenella mellea]